LPRSRPSCRTRLPVQYAPRWLGEVSLAQTFRCAGSQSANCLHWLLLANCSCRRRLGGASACGRSAAILRPPYDGAAPHLDRHVDAAEAPKVFNTSTRPFLLHKPERMRIEQRIHDRDDKVARSIRLRARKVRPLFKLLSNDINKPRGKLCIWLDKWPIANWLVILTASRVRVFIPCESIVPKRVRHFDPPSGAARSDYRLRRVRLIHHFKLGPISGIQPMNECCNLSPFMCLLCVATSVHEQLTAIRRPNGPTKPSLRANETTKNPFASRDLARSRTMLA